MQSRPATRVARPPAARRTLRSRSSLPPRALLDAEGAWQLRGACRRADPELFFHPDRERGEDRRLRIAAAKSICAQCPVVQACREHALLSPERQGVWGGLSESELADRRRSRTC